MAAIAACSLQLCTCLFHHNSHSLLRLSRVHPQTLVRIYLPHNQQAFQSLRLERHSLFSMRSSSSSRTVSSSSSSLPLLSLLTSSTLLGNANASSSTNPPSFLNQLSSSTGSSINLHPPSILQSEIDPHNHLLSDLTRRGVQLDNDSNLRKRAGSSRTAQSSENQDDKSQLLGQMGK